MIVTIDGPAGAGKSTVARLLAERLGFEVLDTGAMYRAVGLALVRAGHDPVDPDAQRAILDCFHLRMSNGSVFLDEEDITREIRTPEISAIAGRIAASGIVRRHLVELQRQVAVGRNLVTEGRDQGTVVFPQAECKFFLIADPVERARRRQRDLEARGRIVAFEKILQDQLERDRRDAERDLAPMVPAADARVCDTTSLTLPEVVDQLEKEVRRCRHG